MTGETKKTRRAPKPEKAPNAVNTPRRPRATRPDPDASAPPPAAPPVHAWQFKARFRRHAFGWRSLPAVARVKEAVSE